MHPPIPDDVRRFVLTRVPSVPFLEAALLLRAEPRAWDAEALARRLYLPLPRAEALLAQLADAGLACADDPARSWRWRPDPGLEGVLGALAAAYAGNLIGVTELIHSRQDRRARQFADAFRWRKD